VHLVGFIIRIRTVSFSQSTVLYIKRRLRSPVRADIRQSVPRLTWYWLDNLRVLSFDARQELEIFLSMLRVRPGSKTLSVSYTICIMGSLFAVEGAEALG